MTANDKTNTDPKVQETSEEVKGHPKDSVNEPLPDENFDSEFSKLGDEFNLFKGMKWTVWEHIEFENKKYGQAVDYDKLYRKVAWIDNIITFHQVWNKIPHSTLSNILYDGETNQFKV